MNLSQLTTADLKVLGSLLREKEALLARVARINAKLNAYGGKLAPPSVPAAAPMRARVATQPVAKPAAPAAAKPAASAVAKAAAPAAAPKPRRNRPGKLKDKILALLQGAGKNGLHIRDLAAKLGVKPQRLYVWFNATGSGVKEIKKVAPATYAWLASPPSKD